MAVAPSGPWSEILYNAQTLIANSANFRTWVGAADVAAARNSIHMVAYEASSPTRPFAIVAQGTDWMHAGAAGGAGITYLTSGIVAVTFEADITEALAADAEFEFTNPVGDILDDCLDLAGTSGYLAVHSFEKTKGPSRSGEQMDAGQGDYYRAKFNFIWGP